MKFQSRRSNILARNGMVATSQPLAAMAGLRMLLAGGNAADAAVASAAALNVLEPFSTGVGGDLFALFWSAPQRRVFALNASGRSPAAADPDQLRRQNLRAIPDDSPYAVTVPGAVSGWQALLDKFGSMPLADALQPAIDYATNGYPVSEIIAFQWQNAQDRLKKLPSGNELLLNGNAPKRGETMRIPQLAQTLQTIADGGADAFYQGPLAHRIANFVQQNGGWLTPEDMAAHAPTWEQPITTNYRGIDIWQCPPNNQGANVLLALNIAEGFDLAHMRPQSAQRHHHLIESARLALTDGMRHITDPDHMQVATETLISKSYAAKRRNLIRPDRAIPNIPVGVKPPDGDTVYITAIDRHGNACSLINSVFSDFGTGLVVPGTGIASTAAAHPSPLTQITPTRSPPTSAPSTPSSPA